MKGAVVGWVTTGEMRAGAAVLSLGASRDAPQIIPESTLLLGVNGIHRLVY